MASLRDAERAREQESERLRLLGAHAISVEEEPVEEAAGEMPDGRPEVAGPAGGETTPRQPEEVGRRRHEFAVVAWFAGEPPATIPPCITVRAGARTTEVPLRARSSEPFRPEGVTVGGAPVGAEASGARTAGAGVSSAEPSGEDLTGAEPAGATQARGEPTGADPAGATQAGGEPTGADPTEEIPGSPFGPE